MLTWNAAVVSVQLGKHEVTGLIPWILPALHGHQNLPSPGQPLGGNLTINESRAGGGLNLGDGVCGPGRVLRTKQQQQLEPFLSLTCPCAGRAGWSPAVCSLGLCPG